MNVVLNPLFEKIILICTIFVLEIFLIRNIYGTLKTGNFRGWIGTITMSKKKYPFRYWFYTCFVILMALSLPVLLILSFFV